MRGGFICCRKFLLFVCLHFFRFWHDLIFLLPTEWESYLAICCVGKSHWILFHIHAYFIRTCTSEPWHQNAELALSAFFLGESSCSSGSFESTPTYIPDGTNSLSLTSSSKSLVSLTLELWGCDYGWHVYPLHLLLFMLHWKGILTRGLGARWLDSRYHSFKWAESKKLAFFFCI